MKAADAVVTLSETMRAEIVSRGVPTDQVVVVPNAVDVERFVPRERDAALAASLGIAADDPVVGYVSSFNAYEGIRYLVEAVATLRAAGRQVRLLLVGDGPDEADIRATAKRLGLDDGTLVMPGRVAHDDVARYHALIDVFVVPRTEDRVSRLVTPLKPFEAMAMERAVVVSDVPALRELVEPGVTGLTFKAEDAAALAEVLAELLDDPTRRQELGRQARAWVLAERTWEANGRRYRELYERLGAA
jgi:glycosyltransferase involved in cell wall biosynthesis